jgi:metal-responsive CopG/Arc/MetJ family transcriptional regulator
MARPKQDQTMETVSVRLPKAMVKEIDGFVKALKGDMPLLNISRADGVRQLLSNAIKAQAAIGRKRAKAKN